MRAHSGRHRDRRPARHVPRAGVGRVVAAGPDVAQPAAPGPPVREQRVGRQHRGHQHVVTLEEPPGPSTPPLPRLLPGTTQRSHHPTEPGVGAGAPQRPVRFGQVAHRRGRPGQPELGLAVDQRRAVGRVVAADVVPGRGQQVAGLGRHRLPVRVEFGRDHRDLGRYRHPQPAGPFQMSQPGPSGHRGQPGRGVGDGRGQRPVLGQPEPGFTTEVGRDDARARLDADQAAAGRRDPDRAQPVVAVRERNHAGGDGRGRPARGTARRVAPVPRVAGRAEGTVGDAEQAQLRHLGQAHDDGARRAQPAHDLVVHRLFGVGGGITAQPHRFARDRDVVLDRDRHPGQRQRALVLDRVDRVGLAQ